MNILLNGESREVASDTTVAELVRSLELASDRVAVEVNRELVRRDRHGERRLAEGDAVEVVTLVGGG